MNDQEEVTMPATQKRSGTATARARGQADTDRLERISKTLEAAQKDLGEIGGSVGTGVRDLRRDVGRLLRDARRDLAKMRRAVQRDLDRLQKDVSSAATANPSTSRRSTAKAPAAGRGARAASGRARSAR
jgi:hypothetical protein